MFDHSSIQRGSFYWVRPKIGRMELKTLHLYDLALFKMEVKIPAESKGDLKNKHKILKCLPILLKARSTLGRIDFYQKIAKKVSNQ